MISKFWITICRFLFLGGLYDAVYWNDIINPSCNVYGRGVCIDEVIEYRQEKSIIFTVVCFILTSSIILLVLMVLMISLIRIAHVTIVFNANIIMMIIIFVVVSIFTFVGYYIGRDISIENFKLLKVLFLRLIVLMLVSFRIVMFVG